MCLLCNAKTLSIMYVMVYTTFYRTMSADHIVTLPDAIKILAKSVLENQTAVLEIRRTFVVKDALKEARKAKFCPTKRAKVV